MSWQLDVTLWLQQFGGLKAVMLFFTFLGREEFFLLLIPLVYLCIDARVGVRLGLLVLLGDALNAIIKVVFHAPRPYWIDSRIHATAPETSFGLPSGHAQDAATAWSFLALQSKKKGMMLSACAVIFLISLSRVYLGVHFVTDVVGGWIIGAAFLLAMLRIMPVVETWLGRQCFWNQVLAVSVGTFLLFCVGVLAAASINGIADPPQWRAYSDGARSLAPLASRCGALWGLGLGWAMMARRAGFDVSGSTGQRVLRYVLAVIGLFACWKGLAAAFPKEPESTALFFRFVRYAIMSWWVVFAAPMVLMRLGLINKTVADNACLE